MSTPIELEPVLLQNDGSNFLSWSLHVLTAFRAISPLVEHIVDASIPLPIVDVSNYKNLSNGERICVQLNAQAAYIMLSTVSAEVREEVIYKGQPPPESAHLIWTRLVEFYGKSKCDEMPKCASMESVLSELTCDQEASSNQQSTEPEPEAEVADSLLSVSENRTCPVSLPDVSGIALAEQPAHCSDDDQARWRPSDESTSICLDTHHLCFMAKNDAKKDINKDQGNDHDEVTQEDDQEESDDEENEKDEEPHVGGLIFEKRRSIRGGVFRSAPDLAIFFPGARVSAG